LQARSRKSPAGVQVPRPLQPRTRGRADISIQYGPLSAVFHIFRQSPRGWTVPRNRRLLVNGKREGTGRQRVPGYAFTFTRPRSFGYIYTIW